MSILTIPYYSELDYKLEKIWYAAATTYNVPGEWSDFLRELDENIIDVEIVLNNTSRATCIKFGKEEHISWFLLRWG